jgi:TonB-linked SusC/RagA family outer membrane protein
MAALAALAIFAGSVSAAAQATSGTVTGTVTDAGTGSPLSSVNVRVTGTQIGAQTAANGEYTIRGVTAGTIDLQFNRIGYEAKHVSVVVAAGQTVHQNVGMSQAAFSLATVVTTVTGAQSKASISNTVATIDVATNIAEKPITSTGELLSGTASGVQVITAGATGGGSRIRIRGQSSLSLDNAPLVYVDGIRVESGNISDQGTGGSSPSALDNIAPEDIETIDVIKGPAAATLYGTQAANGVILITTKKGKVGTTRWNAFAENGLLNDSNKGHYPDLWVGFDKSGAKPAICLLEQQEAGKCHIDSTFHHDVLNDPVTTPLHTGNRQQYGLQVSGGATALQYFLSGDVQHEQGPYKMPQIEINRLMAERGTSIGADQIYPNALKQVNLRSNLSSQFGSRADVALSVGYTDSYIRRPQNEDNSDGLMVDALGTGARTDLVDARGIPLLGYRNYPMGDIFAQRTTTQTNRFINSLTTHYYPLSWLTARANLGFDYSAVNDVFLQEYNQGPYGDSFRNASTNGDAESSRGENDVYTVDGGATANNTFGKFNSKLSAGVQYFRNYYSVTRGDGRNLPPGGTTTSAGAIQTTSQSTTESINLGTYGEEVLSYADRFFLTGGLRYDANSAFGQSFSGVYYPKIGASWLISDESWFPRIDALNSFRLRGTYGASGVQPGTTAALRYYTPHGANIAGVEQSSVSLGALGNPNLKPEYSGEFETGFDMTAFSGRTSLEFTYYNKHTKDALIAAPTAPSLGGAISTQYQNLGAIRNQGVEMTYNQKIIDNNNVGAEVQITGSVNKNRVLTLGEGILPIFTGNRSTQRNAPNYPLYGLWGKNISYNDANGDGILGVNEVSIADTATFRGSSFPINELAVNPRLELLHRKLAIAAQFDHKDGMTKFFNTERHRCQNGLSCRAQYDATAPLALQAAAISTKDYANYAGQFYNGQFTRLREVSVSYQLPDRLAAHLHTSRASIIAAGRNLHVWTAYPGVDPEASQNTLSDSRGNEEYFSTPPLRYFTLRLNLNF